MSKMKSMGMLLGAMAMSMAASDPLAKKYIEPSESEAEKKARLEFEAKQKAKAEIQLKLSKGLKEYVYGKYGENSVWAINQKNADRKAKNNGWI